MLVTRNIDIAATPERVWALVTDPRRRAALNPAIRVIEVEIEGGGPLHRDSATRYRLEIGGQMMEYRTRVLEFVPNRRLVTYSDSAVPFETALELSPLPSGTRLSHSERLEPTADMIQRAIDQIADGRDVGVAERMALWLDGDASERLRDSAVERLEKSLGDTLDQWLAAIRNDLEGSPLVNGHLPA